MAIQMRRGLKVNFDPQKMLPGEWAVSTDQITENQIIWMCFRPGSVKRMGTYEDFREQIAEISDEIAAEFEQTFNEIKVYMEGLRDSAEGYRDEAEGYKNVAAQKAEEANASAESAKLSDESAGRSAVNSAKSADLSEDYSMQSKSYAVGTGGEVRPNDDSDCAEFYYEQTKRIAQGIEGVVPMGTITFAELSDPYNQVKGYMFDISDDFVSDERFKNGAGIYYGAGSNVIYTADGMWDVLASVSVMGVKGDKESIYRQGFVNLTPEDIGAATIDDLEGINADFVGTKEELMEKIASGEVTDGMTAFLKGVGGSGEDDGSSGGGVIIGELTPEKALVSDSEGNVTSSFVTSSELECLAGAKSNIQQQIDSINISGISDVSDATVFFEEAETRENVNSGEATKTLWGKAKKLFSDLKRVAFSNDYNDLDNLPDLSNINKDFVGTKEELDLKIESGEMPEGATIYLTDGGTGSGGSGGGGTIVGNLTPNKAIISDENGNIASSSVTKDELECLSGVKGNVQAQFTSLVNGLLGEKLAKSITIAESLYSMEEISKWGVNSYMSTISNFGFYKPGENRWLDYLKMGITTNDPRYPFHERGTQYLIKIFEIAMPEPKTSNLAVSELGREYGNRLLRADFVLSFMKHFHGWEYNFNGRPDMWGISFYYDSNTLEKSPWVQMIDDIRSEKENGNYSLPVGTWYTESALSKFYQMFFRVTIIDLSSIFSEQFLTDPNNHVYGSETSGVRNGVYMQGFNLDHIPLNGEIKGNSEE